MVPKRTWSKLSDINLNGGSWEIASVSDFGPNAGKSVVNGPFGSDLLTSELQDEGTPVIYSGDFRNGRYVRKKSSKCFVSEEKAEALSAFQTLKGDVILAKVGDPPGAAAIYEDEKKAVVTQDVIRIRPSQDVSSGFLSALMNSDIGKRQIHRIKISGTRGRVSLTDFKKMKLPLAPVAEQRKIADILSTWDQAIEKTEALLSNARTQKRALMQQLLTGKRRFPAYQGQPWKEVHLGDVATIKGGGTPSKSNPSFWGGDLPWVSVKDLKANVLQTTIDHITEEGLIQSASNAFNAGTIIVATRMAVGSTVRLGRRMAINQDLKAILPTNAIANDFLYYHVKMSEAKLAALGTGSTVKGIVLDDLKRLPIYLPESLGEQAVIAKALDDAADEVAALTNNITKLRTEKKALMQQLLTGKRRVVV